MTCNIAVKGQAQCVSAIDILAFNNPPVHVFETYSKEVLAKSGAEAVCHDSAFGSTAKRLEHPRHESVLPKVPFRSAQVHRQDVTNRS